MFVSLELWRGMRRHGLGFAATWGYTQDNWLFSLIPLSALGYEALGPRASVALGFGWAVFVACVGMTGWLTARLAGWRAGLVLASVLAFANVNAAGASGYLTYPLSHNGSMAWALGALILSLLALGRRSYAAAAAAGLAVLANTLSDPWAGVAIAGPLAATAGALALVHRGRPEGRVALTLAGVTIAAAALAQTRIFGLLSFLPASHFRFADLPHMAGNAYWGWRVTGAMFNIAPGLGPEDRLARWLSAPAFLALLAFAVAVGINRLRNAPIERQLVFGTSVLSIAGMAGIYLVGRWDWQLAIGRFFPNLYFLGGLLIACAVADRWSAWGRWPKRCVAAYAALFVVAGLASAPALWLRGPAPPARSSALADFLQAKGLDYGYGVFWGTRALGMDVRTGGKVTIRPVSLGNGRVERRWTQNSTLWYTAADEPASRRRFLALRNDGEECVPIGACVEVAVRQFGPPSEAYVFRDFVILVWPRSIAAKIAS